MSSTQSQNSSKTHMRPHSSESVKNHWQEANCHQASWRTWLSSCADTLRVAWYDECHKNLTLPSATSPSNIQKMHWKLFCATVNTSKSWFQTPAKRSKYLSDKAFYQKASKSIMDCKQLEWMFLITKELRSPSFAETPSDHEIEMYYRQRNWFDQLFSPNR